MTGAPRDPTAAAQLADELRDQVSIDRVLHANDKSQLIVGEYQGHAAVIKVCLTDEKFWLDKFHHEIGVYRAFATCRPPVRVPDLIHTDDDRVIVIEHVAGAVVDTQRYPTHPVEARMLGAILNTLLGFGAWNPPRGALSQVFDYRDRVDRYHRAGIFDDHDRAALHRLIDHAGPVDAVAHGDPLPSNLLISADGVCVPVDFEFTGLFAAGFDLAMLHTLLAATPGAQQSIEAIAVETDIEAAFLLNRAMVVSRELRLHTELDDTTLRAQRLAVIGPQFDALRSRLHDRW